MGGRPDLPIDAFSCYPKTYKGIKKVKSIKDIPKPDGVTEQLKIERNSISLTTALFRETGYGKGKDIFTLEDEDFIQQGKTFYSLKKRYLECRDPHEYTFAVKWIGSWKHWLRIKESERLRPHVEEWADELEVKLRSEGLAKIMKEDSYNANKYIADKGWNKVAGRPTKEAVAGERKKQAAIRGEVSDDADRLGIKFN